MIIHQNQNGSITERKTSPFKKKIHILSEKMNNEISSYKKKSFRNDIFKKPYLEIKNFANNDNNYQSKTIIPHKQKHHNKMEFEESKIKANKSKINSNFNFKRRKNYLDESIFDNKSDKENIYNIPQTSRYDYNSKEKYLKNFFKNIIDSKYNNCFDSDSNKNIEENYICKNIPDSMKTINAHSKRNNSTFINPIGRNNFNKKNNEREKNNSDMILNESIINLQDELNYEFEIKLLKKKLKEKKKINDKLKYKLIKIKNEQKRKIQENKKKKKEFIIISKVIDIYKNLYLSEKNNLESSSNEAYNGLTNSNIISKENKNNCFISFPATKLFKNMLLSLMDLKYEYLNILLKEEFVDGLNNIFDNDNNNEKQKNDLKNNDKFIINNIKELLKEEINLKAIINKYKYMSLENQKYSDYLSILSKKISIKRLDNIDTFLKNAIIKAETEYRQINQIKNIVMNKVTDINEYQKDYNDDIKIYKEQNDDYILERKHYGNKLNSESNTNINLSPIKKEEEKNSNRNLYSKYKYKSSSNKNFFRNKDEAFQKNIFNTYRYSDSTIKNKNKKLLRQASNENINLYDFSKQKDYNYNKRQFLNNDNKEFINEENKYLNENRIEVPHCIKSVKIQPFKCEKRNKKSKNFNNIINTKKRELGLDSKIKNKIKLKTKNSINKRISKSHTKNIYFNNY